jgi:hypothetical protein
MIRDGKRAGDVILRLRNFKASGPEKTSLKINEVVEGIVTLVRHELERNHVYILFHSHLTPPESETCPGQFRVPKYTVRTFLPAEIPSRSFFRSLTSSRILRGM